jgi:hypothetical protein
MLLSALVKEIGISAMEMARTALTSLSSLTIRLGRSKDCRLEIDGLMFFVTWYHGRKKHLLSPLRQWIPLSQWAMSRLSRLNDE